MNTSQNVYLESLLKNLKDVVIFLSSDGTIEELSPIAEEYYSWNVTKMKGIQFSSLLSEGSPFSFSDYVAMRDNGASIETIINHKNPKVYLSWSVVPLANSSGWLLIGRDVSDSDKLEVVHHTLYSQLEKISACVPGNFYWKNTDAEYLGCNDTLLKTLGLTSIKDIIGKTDKDLWPDQAQTLKQNDQQVIQTGKTLFLEEKVTMNGQDRYFTVIKMPLLDDRGNTIGILGNSLEITELKNTQAALQVAIENAEAANRVKTEFIANMGHDIRTPLTGIIGFSHHLKNHIKDIQFKECAKQIHDSGEQLLGLLNSVLDMITADNLNENSVISEVFDVHRLINDVLELEIPAIEEHHLAIKTQIDERIPHYLIGDRMKLHRILLNLVGNAIKFTPKGQIEISATFIEQEHETITIQFKVSDTGIGIPLHLHDKVFESFFKISPSHKGAYTGNGIGLHIAQKYAELLGGDLKLESTEGIGTSFFFSLKMKLANKDLICSSKPQNTAVLEETQTVHSALIEPLHAQQLHVLLIEDNESALKVLKMMIEPYSTHIRTAGDAESAMLFVKESPFDLIISDIGLPNINGDELASNIRAFEKEHQRRPCYIVGLTGHALNDIMDDCIKAGMNEVYRKPMNKNSLKQIINHFNIPDLRQLQGEEKEARIQQKSLIEGEIPKNEKDFFDLNKFPIFDISEALKFVGTEAMLTEVLTVMKDQSVPDDLKLMTQAYAEADWDKVQQIAHKMKSGAIYVGAVRMKMACQYLERYHKVGQRTLLEPLYQQASVVIDHTMETISDYLKG
ncbi:PAS domain-containing sensor histidine kinase [Legionella sp. km535]|uniref:PAS domain-containing sensor histidine kinase n=1 Tax=Legionella sp. km535 TaxID=2498107 RepID=UPI000F8C3083|nr:PAS domain-containing sensor histidine kinase [Legionella sp. km535]RUR20515.1 PAS domain-containing sensor histidine kinase [Legionella sp. km535]